MKNREFEVCVRVIIFKKNKILICKNRKRDYYFFPGGHINFGESVSEALLREIKEELGIPIKKYKFIGTVENIFREDKRHHEFNLVFEVKPGEFRSESKENHISFVLFDLNRFSKEKIFPIALKKAILKWLKNKKIFWASQIYNQSKF